MNVCVCVCKNQVGPLIVKHTFEYSYRNEMLISKIKTYFIKYAQTRFSFSINEKFFKTKFIVTLRELWKTTFYLFILLKYVFFYLLLFFINNNNFFN